MAADVEDYYLGPTEAPGRWAASADLLGLAGEVVPEQLRAVLAGSDPGTGKALAVANRRRAGFNLTFSAPKPASLLWALGGPDVAAEVIAAHEEAVDAALGWLEAQVGTRGGHNGVVRLPGGGLVAAGFGHRSSRAGDPQVHTHVLVANLTPGVDRRWGALDGRSLYAAARTAGFFYEARWTPEPPRTMRWGRSSWSASGGSGLRASASAPSICQRSPIPRPTSRRASRPPSQRV